MPPAWALVVGMADAQAFKKIFGFCGSSTVFRTINGDEYAIVCSNDAVLMRVLTDMKPKGKDDVDPTKFQRVVIVSEKALKP